MQRKITLSNKAKSKKYVGQPMVIPSLKTRLWLHFGLREIGWSLVIGHWFGGGGLRLLVIGHWSLVTGHWSLVIGHWSLVIGHWSLVTGTPSKDKGQRTNDK
jgi:hypothetical protein